MSSGLYRRLSMVKFYTPKEFAETVNISLRTLSNLIQKRKIDFVKIGGRYRIPETVLDQPTWKQRGIRFDKEHRNNETTQPQGGEQ
jgi:excisionase family DNA binding protein